jgi:uncharacterized protein
VEFKASEEEKGVIEGYAAYYNNIDRHGDIIEPGTFKNARKVPIFGYHDPREGVGVGEVKEDKNGLRIKMRLAINAESERLRQRALEYYSMVKEGIISRMSVGFIVNKAEEDIKEINGQERFVRVIKEGELLEVSLVPIPANDKARVTNVKALEDRIEKLAAENEELKKTNDELRSYKKQVEQLQQSLYQMGFL